jgi:hypothetical protein
MAVKFSFGSYITWLPMYYSQVSLLVYSIANGGLLGPWTPRPVDNSDRRQLGPWTNRTPDTSACGQLGPNTAWTVNTSARRQLYKTLITVVSVELKFTVYLIHNYVFFCDIVLYLFNLFHRGRSDTLRFHLCCRLNYKNLVKPVNKNCFW